MRPGPGSDALAPRPPRTPGPASARATLPCPHPGRLCPESQHCRWADPPSRSRSLRAPCRCHPRSSRRDLSRRPRTPVGCATGCRGQVRKCSRRSCRRLCPRGRAGASEGAGGWGLRGLLPRNWAAGHWHPGLRGGRRREGSRSSAPTPKFPDPPKPSWGASVRKSSSQERFRRFKGWPSPHPSPPG